MKIPNDSVYLSSFCFYRKPLHLIHRICFAVLITFPEKASATLIIPSAQVLFLDLPLLNKEAGKPLFKMQTYGIVL